MNNHHFSSHAISDIARLAEQIADSQKGKPGYILYDSELHQGVLDGKYHIERVIDPVDKDIEALAMSFIKNGDTKMFDVEIRDAADRFLMSGDQSG